eukprot:GFYU01026220.1.p1 GENE.GFYU01026220.1~~GFYU01026220.1.p1  ORF type:complete len:442 (-),score=54.52 GFYU01026220.1:127-1410(-)
MAAFAKVCLAASTYQAAAGAVPSRLFTFRTLGRRNLHLFRVNASRVVLLRGCGRTCAYSTDGSSDGHDPKGSTKVEKKQIADGIRQVVLPHAAVSTSSDNQDGCEETTSRAVWDTTERKRVAEFDAVLFHENSYEYKSTDKFTLASMLSVPARDLRAIDVSYREALPSIAVREKAILVRLQHVKAIILSNQTLLFDPRHPDVAAFIPILDARLRDSNGNQPYEFRALEAILEEVCDLFERHVQVMSPSIHNILDNLSYANLEQLLPLKKSLNVLDINVNGVKSCVSEVLQNDEDMAGMYLSSKLSGVPRSINEHEELEMLLETYDRQVSDIRSQLKALRRTMIASEELLEMKLNTTRNRIMQLNLMLSVGTFSMSTGALTAGLLGMNLANHFEDHPTAFAIVTSGVFMSSACICISGFIYCRNRKLI